MIISILAIDNNNAIGFKNSLPWPRIKEDMRFFAQTTTNHTVVMGRNTWESLGPYAPLKNRKNVVVSSGDVKCPLLIRDIRMIPGFDKMYADRDVFIIGGKKLYESTIDMVEKVLVTRINGEYEADTFLDIDNLLNGFSLTESNKIKTESNIDITFEQWCI